MLTYDPNDDADDIETPTWGKSSTPQRGIRSNKLPWKTIVGVVAVLSVFAGSYIYVQEKPASGVVEETSSLTPVPTTNDYVSTLNQLEANKDYVGLIKNLYENTDPAYSAAVLPWLKERENSGFTPYLYATSRHMLITNEPYQALLYYTAAGLSARVDVARCSDRSAAGWVAFLENGFNGVQEYMAANPESKKTAGDWAMMKEESLKDRALPEWLCLNGENPSEYVPYVSEESWQNERAEIRRAFEQYIAGNDHTDAAIAETAPASGQ